MQEPNQSHQSGSVFSSFPSPLLSGITGTFGGRWCLSLHGETFCAPTLGRHGWRWRAGWAVHLLRMSCKCCALLGAAAVLLLLSLLGRGAGSEAPAEPEEPTHSRSPALPRDSVWIWKLLMPSMVALSSSQCLWSGKPRRSQLLSQGEGYAVVANSFWCHFTLLAGLQHGHSTQ